RLPSFLARRRSRAHGNYPPSIGADPVQLVLAGTDACTFGFMLPVSTPTNALACATGYIEQRQMIRWGIVLDVIGAVLLSLWFGLVST
ncbi:MAG: anion permease, partial [bacterium]